MFWLSTLELKKIFKNKGIYIGILLSSIFAIAIGMQAKISPTSFSSKHVFSFFASIANLVVIVYASKSLGDEFQLKTSTQLFTSKQSRANILISKALSLTLLAVILGIISAAILITFKFILNEPMTLQIGLNDLWIQIFTFVIYAFVVGTFASLITTINFNTTSTLVTTLSAFWIAPNIISMLIEKFPQAANILRMLPFYSADSLTSYHSVDSIGIIVLIAFGFIVFASNIKLISKMDLR